MTAPRGSSAAELDASPRRAREAGPGGAAGASAVVARGRQRVSSALDHATLAMTGHPAKPNRRRAGAGHREPKSLISNTRGPATATKRPFGRVFGSHLDNRD